MPTTTSSTIDLAPLDRLTAGRKPRWGRMTAQHMVEHLAATVRLSNGAMTVTAHVAPDRRPAMKRYLFSDRPFARHGEDSTLPPDLIPLRHGDLTSALEALREEIARFEAYHAAHPEATPHHPVGGPLTHDEWLAYHARHNRHHFTQFGLVEE